MADDASGKFIAIGIDFGTTFSGVSWAFSEHPDQIREISDWPSSYHANQSEVQVPSLYDLQSQKWGYEVTTDMKPLKWFKLLLLKPDDIKPELRDTAQLQDAQRQLAEHPDKLTAVKVVGQYLEKLWKHTLDSLRTMLNIDTIPLRVGITVPALWPPYAQQAMRDAAELAGILAERDAGVTELDIIQEPEAAAVSILFERSDLPEIQNGETFVVCDAGGGTIDVISYTVICERPFVLRECVGGEGDLAGAVSIDDAFESHLRDKTKMKISSLSDSEYNSFVRESWERGLKRSFSNVQELNRYSLQPPSKAFSTLDRIRSRDSLAFNRGDMELFFSRSLASIRSLVDEQYKQVEKETGRPPKRILLVGGLGSSLYIYSVLNEQFKGIVLRPLNGWSAVARGAVLRLIRDNVSSEFVGEAHQIILDTLPDVRIRKSRYSYGIVAYKTVAKLKDFDEVLDKTEIDKEGRKVTLRMDWYLKKGDDIVKREPVVCNYRKSYKKQAPPTCSFQILYCSSDIPPVRKDKSVLKLCRLECDWDKPFEEWARVSDPISAAIGWRKHTNMSVEMTCEGEPKWKIKVGKNGIETPARIEYFV